MSTIDIARLRALAEAATPGEWRIETDSEESYEGGIPYSEWPGTLVGPENAIPSQWAIDHDETNRIVEISELRMEDAAYIAAADPPTILALLDEIERLRVEGVREYAARDKDGHIPFRGGPYTNRGVNLTELAEDGFTIYSRRTTPWEQVTGDAS